MTVLLHSPSYKDCVCLPVIHISLTAYCHLQTATNSVPHGALQRTQDLQSEGKEEFKICQALWLTSDFYHCYQAWAFSKPCTGL